MSFFDRPRLKTRSSLRVAFVAGVGLLAASCQPSIPPAPNVDVIDAWARPSRAMMNHSPAAEPAAAPVSTSAVYLTLRNTGTGSDTLMTASTDFAKAVEMHESRMEDGIMRMRQVQNIAIPAGGSVELRPGGLHIMLIGVTRDLALGDRFAVTLRLAQSGERSVDVTVRQPE